MSTLKSPAVNSWRYKLVVIAAVVLLLDQASKWMVLRWLEYGHSVSVIPGFFNLTLVFNKGVAFGALSNLPDVTRQVLIAVATLTALVVVFYLLVRHYYADAVATTALSMIVGGALGNIVDRLRLGKVVDFLDVYYAAYHWPAFNVADSAVCIGVAILLLRPGDKR